VSVSVPILLAVAGTGLMAVAIFVPFRGEAPNAEFESDEATAAVPLWPTLVGPTAAGCDVDARLDLIDALASIGSPWALGVLQHAKDEEPDPAVRAAIDAALAAAIAPPATASLAP
jgi:hypothetical protein